MWRSKDFWRWEFNREVRQERITTGHLISRFMGRQKAISLSDDE